MGTCQNCTTRGFPPAIRNRNSLRFLRFSLSHSRQSYALGAEPLCFLFPIASPPKSSRHVSNLAPNVTHRRSLHWLPFESSRHRLHLRRRPRDLRYRLKPGQSNRAPAGDRFPPILANHIPWMLHRKQNYVLNTFFLHYLDLVGKMLSP